MILGKSFAAQIIFLRARPHRLHRLRNLSNRHSNNYRLKHRRLCQMIQIARHLRGDRVRSWNCLVRCYDQSYSKRGHTTS